MWPQKQRWPRGLLGWVVRWTTTHRYGRLLVPIIGLAILVGSLVAPLVNDLRRLGEGDLYRVGQQTPGSAPAASLIVNVRDVNPNNGIATLEVSYFTNEVIQGGIELWLASGRVTSDDAGSGSRLETELRRVPVVMDNPTVFVWQDTKRVIYKRSDIAVKVDGRTPGYLYPFDHYALELRFTVIRKGRDCTHPAIWFQLSDPRFVHSKAREVTVEGTHADSIPDSLHVELDRPTYQKIFLGLTLFMGLGSVFWSLLKITYTSIDAMDALSLLAFNLTILLAAPGLRVVFVPINLQFAPLFDFFVVLIWAIGLLSLFVNIIKHDVVVRLQLRHRATDVGSMAASLGEPRTPRSSPT